MVSDTKKQIEKVPEDFWIKHIGIKHNDQNTWTDKIVNNVYNNSRYITHNSW